MNLTPKRNARCTLSYESWPSTLYIVYVDLLVSHEYSLESSNSVSLRITTLDT